MYVDVCFVLPNELLPPILKQNAARIVVSASLVSLYNESQNIARVLVLAAVYTI